MDADQYQENLCLFIGGELDGHWYTICPTLKTVVLRDGYRLLGGLNLPFGEVIYRESIYVNNGIEHRFFLLERYDRLDDT